MFVGMLVTSTIPTGRLDLEKRDFTGVVFMEHIEKASKATV